MAIQFKHYIPPQTVPLKATKIQSFSTRPFRIHKSKQLVERDVEPSREMKENTVQSQEPLGQDTNARNYYGSEDNGAEGLLNSIAGSDNQSPDGCDQFPTIISSRIDHSLRSNQDASILIDNVRPEMDIIPSLTSCDDQMSFDAIISSSVPINEGHNDGLLSMETQSGTPALQTLDSLSGCKINTESDFDEVLQCVADSHNSNNGDETNLGSMSDSTEANSGAAIGDGFAQISDKEWVVCEFLEKKEIAGVIYYLARWEDTWVPKYDCRNAKALVNKFEAQRAKRSQRRRKKSSKQPQSKGGVINPVKGASADGVMQQRKGRGRPRKQTQDCPTNPST